MKFEDLKTFGSYISKDYAGHILKLLVMYRDISASEAASRLNMHIRTAQEFLDAMAGTGFAEKTEVFEGKRPYFRYKLKSSLIIIEFNLNSLLDAFSNNSFQELKIRERKYSGAKFTIARNAQAISNIAFWVGSGREKSERKINLTDAQGKFLYNLPFPSADFMSISELLIKAGIVTDLLPEIEDIVKLLIGFKVIETK